MKNRLVEHIEIMYNANVRDQQACVRKRMPRSASVRNSTDPIG